MSTILVEAHLILDLGSEDSTVCEVVLREIEVPHRSTVLSRLAEFWNSEDCAAIIYIDPCPSRIIAIALGAGQEFAILVTLEGEDTTRMAVIPRGCTLACTALTFRELSVLC